MGYYINPPNETKEAWLNTNGVKVSRAEALAHNFADDTLPVCLVNNGAFTAAGIAYSPAELDAFSEVGDPRPKVWFIVSKQALKPYYKA
jgi:hypothetical protein